MNNQPFLKFFFSPQIMAVTGRATTRRLMLFGILAISSALVFLVYVVSPEVIADLSSHCNSVVIEALGPIVVQVFSLFYREGGVALQSPNKWPNQSAIAKEKICSEIWHSEDQCMKSPILEQVMTNTTQIKIKMIWNVKYPSALIYTTDFVSKLSSTLSRERNKG